MKNGFYLSTYLEIDKVGNVYQYAHRHNMNLSLWLKDEKNVTLVHYWELERLTGHKQHQIAFFDKQQLVDIINGLLSKYHLTMNDMVDIWGTPQLQTNDTYGSEEEYTKYSYHSISHLFSSIMIDTSIFGNENILGLAIDGAPDKLIDVDADNKSSYVGCYSKKGKIQLFSCLSPGPFWQLANYHFKLREGTLMALASASTCEIDFPEDISMIRYAEKNDPYQYITDLLDYSEHHSLMQCDPLFSQSENYISAIMKKIQSDSINLMTQIIDRALQDYSINPQNTYLSLSGGSTLNCPMNSYIMKHYSFKQILAPPSVDDSGQSLGIALHSFYKMEGEFHFNLKDAYYGDDDLDLSKVMDNEFYKPYVVDISDVSYTQIVQDIIAEPIIWFYGRAEIGPRALGNRSIIADPRYEVSKKRLNEVKQRQWWRPVAPILLSEHVHEWFDDAYESPYMLHTFNINKEKKPFVPAIIHLDGTARVQTISDQSSSMYQLLQEFYRQTGVPILCNTSLNDRGEPIINTIEEAMNFALRKGFHIIYINKKRILLHNHTLYSEHGPIVRDINIAVDPNRLDLLKHQLNPYRLDEDQILYCLQNNLFHHYDINKEEDVKAISVITKIIKRQKVKYSKLLDTYTI